jgi:hypothetical protein
MVEDYLEEKALKSTYFNVYSLRCQFVAYINDLKETIENKNTLIDGLRHMNNVLNAEVKELEGGTT